MAADPYGVIAVDTHYTRPFQDASHLLIANGRAAFVDTGVNRSVPLLLAALQQHDIAVGDVDYVFLTHVHLDHAGGAGLLMRSLPNATCVIHPFGARHMVDPTRLIAGTNAVYGTAEAQRLYGTILPVDEKRVAIAADEQWFEFGGRALQSLHTQGHARHHYVLHDPASRGVFTGDSFGVSYRELDSAAGANVFPTTTPVQFDPQAAHAAIDRIMACDPKRLYLTHYSRVEGVERLAAQMHAGIDAFVAIAHEHADNDERTTTIQAAMLDYMIGHLSREGYPGDAATISDVMALDIELNTQGLEHWLEKVN